MITRKPNKNNGYSLVEMVIYVSILSIITLLVINSVLAFTTSYKEIKAIRLADSSAINALERITRDVRKATSIDVVNSVFGSNPGALVLIEIAGGNSTTTRFYLDDGVVRVDINGAYSGPVTLSSATVSELVFRKIDSTNSSAIKIDMTVSGEVSPVTKTKNYHTTIIQKNI